MATRKRSKSTADAEVDQGLRRELREMAEVNGLSAEQLRANVTFLGAPGGEIAIFTDDRRGYVLSANRDEVLRALTRMQAEEQDAITLRLSARLLLAIGRDALLGGTEHRAKQVLDAWATILPARIASEDLADYLEDIHRRAAAGQHGKVVMRTIAAMFWTLVNAVGYTLERLNHKKGA
jgi:hypothetical protein